MNERTRIVAVSALAGALLAMSAMYVAAWATQRAKVPAGPAEPPCGCKDASVQVLGEVKDHA